MTTLNQITPDHFTTYLSHLQALHTNKDGTINFLHPCALAASENNDNTMHYGEMIKAMDRAKFEDAMDAEVQGLSKSEIYVSSDGLFFLREQRSSRQSGLSDISPYLMV